jgi:hypothetical protein
VSLSTEYPFTLPRGYVDAAGTVHRDGVMRLATARDELEPLRDPRVNGPEDPQLTVLVLARVVRSLGDLPQVTSHEIENLFAVDLAFLQDFYGVINFGTQEEYDALIQAQQDTSLVGSARRPSPRPTAEAGDERVPPHGATPSAPSEGPTTAAGAGRRPLRAAVEEIPRRAN